jgi:hypothetical protein
MPKPVADVSLGVLGILVRYALQQALKTCISVWCEYNDDEAVAEDLEDIHTDPERGLVYGYG